MEAISTLPRYPPHVVGSSAGLQKIKKIKKIIKEGTSADTRWSHGGATHTYFSFWVSNLKMCTVSVLLEADRYRPSMLNASEQMLTHLDKSDEATLEVNKQTNRRTD